MIQFAVINLSYRRSGMHIKMGEASAPNSTQTNKTFRRIMLWLLLLLFDVYRGQCIRIYRFDMLLCFMRPCIVLFSCFDHDKRRRLMPVHTGQASAH